MSRKLAILLSVCAALGLTLAACGGDDEETTAASSTSTTTSAPASGGGSGGGGTVSFAADPSGSLAYTETEVTAEAGTNTIEFDNPAQIAHDVVIEDDAGSEVAATDVITGSTTSTTAELEPGAYTFYCSIPGHQEAGMEGTLEVE
jgi:plastocyanin